MARNCVRRDGVEKRKNNRTSTLTAATRMNAVKSLSQRHLIQNIRAVLEVCSQMGVSAVGIVGAHHLSVSTFDDA